MNSPLILFATQKEFINLGLIYYFLNIIISFLFSFVSTENLHLSFPSVLVNGTLRLQMNLLFTRTAM